MLVKVVWINNLLMNYFLQFISMYMYIIEEFRSSCFMECTSIMIHRTVFQYITIHGHQQWLIRASQN